jgi:hypothetical protein
VKKQAYDLGAKLGDSPTTRLTERFEPATPVTGGDTYYVFFTVKDNQQEFESKLALLGKVNTGYLSSTQPRDALDSLAILGQTGAYTYTGVPLGSYVVWSVEGLDAFFYFYSIATHTDGKYTLNGKPIVDNVVCISVQRVQSATMPTAKP